MSPSPPRPSPYHKHRRSRSRSSSSLSSLLSYSFPNDTPTRADLDQLDIIVELLKRDGRRQDKRRARRQRRERERSDFFASSQGSGSSYSSSRHRHGRSEEEQPQPASSPRRPRHQQQQQEEEEEEEEENGSSFGSGSSSLQRYRRDHDHEDQSQPQATSSSSCPCHEHREEEAQQPFWKPATSSDSQSTIVLAGSRDKPIPVIDEEDAEYEDEKEGAGVEKAATPRAPLAVAAATTPTMPASAPKDRGASPRSATSTSRLTRHASPMVLIPALPTKRRRTKSPSPTPRRRRSSSSSSQRSKARPSPRLSPVPRVSSSFSSSASRRGLRERSLGARQRMAEALASDDSEDSGSEWGEKMMEAKGMSRSRAVSSDLSDLSEEDEEAQKGEASQTSSSSQRNRGTERPLEDTYLSLATRRDLYCLSLCYERTTTQTNLLGCILAHVGPTGKYPKVDLRETLDLNGVFYGHEIRLGALMLIAQNRVDEALSTIEVAPGVSEKQMSHLCHNRACIHPGHIVVETRLENDLRNQCKGHTDEVTCTHGPGRCLLPYKWQCEQLGMELDRDGAFKTVDTDGRPLTRIERPPRLIPTFEPLMEREREEREIERLRRLAADAAPLAKRKRGRPPGTGKRQREEQERLQEARLEGWRLARERREEEEQSELVAMRAAAAAAASAAATAASARAKKRPILPPDRRRNLALESDWDLN